MWCSLLDLKMNAQSFRLRPAAFWEMQVEILPVGVWTHGWLRPHPVKYRYISMWVQKKTQMHVGKGKRWGVMPLVKCNVAIATSAFGCRLKYVWEKKKQLSSKVLHSDASMIWSTSPFFMSWVRRSRKWGFPLCVAYVRSGRKWISGPENTAGSLENRFVSE